MPGMGRLLKVRCIASACPRLTALVPLDMRDTVRPLVEYERYRARANFRLGKPLLWARSATSCHAPK
ncbi:protein of unknown function [Paraburkholderia kururiensis]